jgi:hypothetical protein
VAQNSRPPAHASTHAHSGETGWLARADAGAARGAKEPASPLQQPPNRRNVAASAGGGHARAQASGAPDCSSVAEDASSKASAPAADE